MNSPRFRALVLLASAAAAWLALLAPTAPAGEQAPIVREIVVRGYPGDPAAITDLIQTQQGRPLDLATLNDDLARLLKAGYLASVRQVTVPDGVRLILDIAESPRVGTVEVRGTGRSWNRRLADELLMRPGTPIPTATLQLPEAQRYRGDKQRIRAYCQQRGYRAVTITSTTTRRPDTNLLDVTFRVRLGPKYQVKWLRFQGNQGIATRELRRRMQTKRDGFWTSRRYYDRFFDDDILALQDYYRFKGYPNARVTYRRAFRGRRANKVDITIFVHEGQQFPTARLSFTGNKSVSTDTLRATVPLKPGATYSDEALVESRAAILRLFREIGYAYATVRPRRQITPEGDAFDVAFEIAEGEQITINTVRTSGHPRTRREVILRELELEPGMVYDVRKLERSQRALDRLQYFDQITMKLAPAEPPAPGERDLSVDVVEGRTGFFRFGVGFSSADAFIGTIDLTRRNFERPRSWFELLYPANWVALFSGSRYRGAGQFFRVALMPGTNYSAYLIRFEDPYWRGRNESFGWSIYYRTRDQDTWDEQRIGIRLTRGIRKYKGDPDTDMVFHLRLESVGVLNVDKAQAPDDADDEEGTHPLLGLGVTVQRDRTDRPTLPTKGYQWEGGPELVVPHGIKFGVGGTRFWTLGSKRPQGHERVLSLRGRVDYALGTFPIYERYYAGAPLIRGFEYRGAGPHDNDEPEGGKYRVVLSAEYRYPLVANRLYSVLFCDTGTVTRDFSLFAEPRVAVGLGFRLLIPQISRAPLSLDFGVPIIKQSDDDTEILYFSVSLGR